MEQSLGKKYLTKIEPQFSKGVGNANSAVASQTSS